MREKIEIPTMDRIDLHVSAKVTDQPDIAPCIHRYICRLLGPHNYEAGLPVRTPYRLDPRSKAGERGRACMTPASVSILVVHVCSILMVVYVWLVARWLRVEALMTSYLGR